MSRLSYKFRLYPNKTQTVALDRSLWLLRTLYNAAIQERKEAWKLNRVNISFADQSKQMPDIRQNDSNYMDVQARVCLQTLRQVDKAFRSFFRRVRAGAKPGYPRFKSRDRFKSFFYNREGFKFIDGKLQLANIGLVKIKQHRQIEGTIKEVAVRRENSKWFVLVSCDGIPIQPLIQTGEAVGIDAGIENFITLSDGTQIENWKHYESSAQQLRVAQRRVARRKKGSSSRRKARAILRNIHQKIRNRRSDFQHKISRHLVNHYDLIAVEDLNVKGLAKGRLSKQVHDVAWSEFFRKLAYKAESAGRQLVKVRPHFTSQDCSGCGNRLKKDLSVREHNCLICGLSLHRDHNAALNILSAGLADKGLKYPVADCLPLAVAA